jgi:hypothetical protein
MVDVLPEGPASQTGPELFRFGNIVAFHPQNSVVLYVKLEGASPAAVEGGSGADDLNVAIGLADYVIAHLFFPLAKNIFNLLNFEL